MSEIQKKTKKEIKETKETKEVVNVEEIKKIVDIIDYVARAKEARNKIIAVVAPVEMVKVPEWGLNFPVYIKTMTAFERDEFESNQFLEDQDGNKTMSLLNMRAAMLVSVLCIDPEGQYKIFTEKEDVIALGKKSVKAIDMCLSVSRRLNGITEEDEEALLKNSEGQEENSG